MRLAWFAFAETWPARLARGLAQLVIGIFAGGAAYLGLVWLAATGGYIDVYAHGYTPHHIQTLMIQSFVVAVALSIARAHIHRLAERELLEHVVGEDLLEDTIENGLETYDSS